MRIQTTISKKLRLMAMSLMLVGAGAGLAQGQSRKDVFQPGEELVYNVKYGFVKLGTVVIQTGSMNSAGQMSARMSFWTADVPFLNTKSTVTDVIDTKDISLLKFNEKAQNGDRVTNKQFVFDRAAKTLSYSDDKVSNEITSNVTPFNDALSLVFNMRAWSGAVGKSYSFPMRNHDGQKSVVVKFTNQLENQEVAALDDKEISTRVVEGQADMGNSSPLGANGAFTAYMSNDEAAVPVRIDMKIAVGSISLTLEKIKRHDWTAAK